MTKWDGSGGSDPQRRMDRMFLISARDVTTKDGGGIEGRIGVCGNDDLVFFESCISLMRREEESVTN